MADTRQDGLRQGYLFQENPMSKPMKRVAILASALLLSGGALAQNITVPPAPPESLPSPPPPAAITPPPAPIPPSPALLPGETPPPNVDSNGDGIADAWDKDGDGKADAWDKDGDGKSDKIKIQSKPK